MALRAESEFFVEEGRQLEINGCVVPHDKVFELTQPCSDGLDGKWNHASR